MNCNSCCSKCDPCNWCPPPKCCCKKRPEPKKSCCCKKQKDSCPCSKKSCCSSPKRKTRKCCECKEEEEDEEEDDCNCCPCKDKKGKKKKKLLREDSDEDNSDDDHRDRKYGGDHGDRGRIPDDYNHNRSFTLDESVRHSGPGPAPQPPQTPQTGNVSNAVYRYEHGNTPVESKGSHPSAKESGVGTGSIASKNRATSTPVPPRVIRPRR